MLCRQPLSSLIKCPDHWSQEQKRLIKVGSEGGWLEADEGEAIRQLNPTLYLRRKAKAENPIQNQSLWWQDFLSLITLNLYFQINNRKKARTDGKIFLSPTIIKYGLHRLCLKSIEAKLTWAGVTWDDPIHQRLQASPLRQNWSSTMHNQVEDGLGWGGIELKRRRSVTGVGLQN